MLSINRPKSSKFASTKGNIIRVQERVDEFGVIVEEFYNVDVESDFFGELR